jgi:hypothetical protein
MALEPTSTLPKRSRARRFAFAALAALGSVAVCLIIVELALAWIKPAASYRKWYEGSLTYLLDDDVDWKLEPRSYPWGQVNSFNFRGPPIGPERTPGRLRIVLLGGSAAFDLGKRDDQTWAVHLEALLTEKLGRPVEIVNTGTPGYSTWQCARVLASKMLPWQPDAVLLYELYNDSLTFRHADVQEIIEGWKLNARANYVGAVAHPHPFWDASGALMPHLADYARMSFVQRALQANKARNDRVWVDLTLSGEVQPHALAFYRDNRQRIANVLAGAGGIPLIVVTQASLIRPDNTPEECQRIHYWYRGLSHERLVAAYRQAWDIDRKLPQELPNVSVIAAHEHVPATFEYFADEVHLTHAGSAFLARYLAQELVERSLLPR